MSGNPFDLSDRKAGPRLAKKTRVYSDDEVERMLEGYVEIPREFWGDLAYNRHVRYFETPEAGGGFKSGYVGRGRVDAKDPETGELTPGLQLKSMMFRTAHNYIQWRVPHANVHSLFARMDAMARLSRHNLEVTISRLNKRIRRLQQGHRAHAPERYEK